MLNMIKMLVAFRASTRVNLFYYYMQKLPLIGQRFPDGFYANIGFKQGVAVIAFIMSMLLGFAFRFAYVGLMLYMPVIALGEQWSSEERLNGFVHLFVMLSFVVAAISSATILEPKREKYVAVKLMRIAPERYMRAVLAYRYLTFLIYLLPAMLLFIKLLGGSAIEAVMLSLALTVWRLGSEYVHARIYDKTGTVLVKHMAIVWTSIAAGFALAYVPLAFGYVPFTGALMLHGISLAGLMIIGVAGALKLGSYDGFQTAVDAATKRDDPLLDLGRMMSEAQKSSVQSKESDYSLTGDGMLKLEGKEGYAYLNEIFFSRHSSLIRGPIKKRLIIAGAAGVIGVAAVTVLQGKLPVITMESRFFPAVLMLALYSLSVGEAMCKAMFYNCDLSLMRYGFYRADAPKHFQVRLIRMLRINLLIAVVFGASVTAVLWASGGPPGAELLLLWLAIFALAVFFTVHHLFMYYIFQPYSSEWNLKNPFYFIVNMLVSASYSISIIFGLTMGSFAALWMVLAPVYTVAALLAVRKHGARTFRVK